MYQSVVIFLDVRCQSCKVPLASSLAPISPEALPRGYSSEYTLLQPFNYIELGKIEGLDIQLSELKNSQTPGPHSNEDLILHPQWCRGWKNEWPTISTHEACWNMQINTQYAFYGCCGPMGQVNCSCGAPVGGIFADCYSAQWLRLEHKAIERSDQASGSWKVFRPAKLFIEKSLSKTEWIEASGQLIKGKKEGEWEIWHCYKPIGTTPQEDQQILIQLEQWENGKLLDYDAL